MPENQRHFPQFDLTLSRPRRPISFVCLQFCNDYDHNLALSPCVHDPLNQLIVVDNRQSLHFPTLGAALIAGMEQARHELIALVHEDVLLRKGWQARFEASLTALETEHTNWGMLGAVGWIDDQSAPVGH